MSCMSSLVKDLRVEINAHQSHRQIATYPSVTIFTASPDITSTSETSMAVDLQSSTPAVAVPIRTTPAINLTPTPRPCARVRTSSEKVEKSQRSSQSAKERRKKERRKVRTAKQNAGGQHSWCLSAATNRNRPPTCLRDTHSCSKLSSSFVHEACLPFLLSFAPK